MVLLQGILLPFQMWNDTILRVGRWISIVAIALMVVAILVQVFFRYALNNALPWPDEAARFMMLWMTGLMAPMAYDPARVENNRAISELQSAHSVLFH